MPDAIAEQFRAWVDDPARTNDELLPVVYFTYWGWVVWGWKHESPAPFNYDARRAEEKHRRQNPGVRPRIGREELEATIEVWPEVKKLESPWHDHDRPVRDLAALRFLPQLEEVSLREAEVRDLSPLTGLRAIRSLLIAEPPLSGGHATTDLSPLAGLAIEKLSLDLRTPWIDFGVLATLGSLRELTLRINLIALESLPILQAAEIITLSCDFRNTTPVRSFRGLPAMPVAQRLQVGSVASLEGIERASEVRNLELAGPFVDLSPLEKLSKVTFLRLAGEQFTDLTPLARMPALRELLIVREIPFDLAPLTDSVSLREVRVERCDIVATELAAINAALNPDLNDFLADTPRPLGPLRFLTYHPQHEELRRLRTEFPRDPQADGRTREYGADVALSAAEGRWGSEQVRLRLRSLLGDGCGTGDGYAGAGHISIALRRYPDMMRLREVIQVLREFSAASRFPWSYLLRMEPHGDMSDTMEELRLREAQPATSSGDWLVREFDLEQERAQHEEFTRRRREEYERRAAEHRHRLQQEQEIASEELSAPAIPPQKPSEDEGVVAADDQDPDLTRGDDEEDGNGGVGLMEAPPGEQINEDLSAKLSFIVTLEENILWATSHMLEGAEYCYGEPAENWHALAEPIQDRPRPEVA